MEEQYPEYRQTLAELVKAAKDVPPRKLDIWLGCYGKVLGHEGRSSTKPPKNTRTTGGRPLTDVSTTAATQAASRLSTGRAMPPATQSDIEQRVEAEGDGSVTMEGMEAVHDGKSGLGTVRQVIKASGKSAIHTGPIKAHVGH
ncbi:hypothetical protein [Cystobacter fuscus]|uniref:hypothetical protein n=1 Tax=Cystobacter fuscus TaxID=43 RepID=UPI002B2FE9FF|nr:hypothetical protein F0U63_45815 [Cystobacter fuscus]